MATEQRMGIKLDAIKYQETTWHEGDISFIIYGIWLLPCTLWAMIGSRDGAREPPKIASDATPPAETSSTSQRIRSDT